MKIFFISLAITVSLFASPAGKWENTQQKIKIEFKKNGKFIWQVNQNIIKGTWKQKNAQIIQTYVSNGVTEYGFMVKGNMLGLLANNGAQMYLTKVVSSKVNQTQKQNTTQQKGFLSDKEFLYLLQNYATMNPNIVYNYLTRFNKNQQSWIPIYQAWYGMMVFRACQGTSAYVRANDKQMCANAKRSYLNTMNLLKSMPANMRDPWSNAKSQTTQLMIHYKCKLGLLDNYTCKNHVKIQSGINKVTNQNTKTIIKGFEAAPCKDHYEQGTNVYLGCY